MDDYVFEFERWKRQFPLEAWHPHFDSDIGRLITSPIHLAVVEQSREKVASRGPLRNGIPTDIFTFGLGEPSRADVTKVGGRPYRPATSPWPKASDGSAMTFLAQFRFAESQDIVGDLPGDMMLIFASRLPPIERDPDAFFFEWQPLGLDTIPDKNDVPKPAWTFVNCYGIRHRSYDFPESFQEFWRIGIPGSAAVLCGTKIGGVPYLTPSPELIDQGIELRGFKGTFLCSLGSIACELGCPYPWVNTPDPLELDYNDLKAFFEVRQLMLGDAGTLYFFMNDLGNIEWCLE